MPVSGGALPQLSDCELHMSDSDARPSGEAGKIVGAAAGVGQYSDGFVDLWVAPGEFRCDHTGLLQGEQGALSVAV